MRRAAALALSLGFVALTLATGTAAPSRSAEEPVDELFIKGTARLPLTSDVELDPTEWYTFEVSGEVELTTGAGDKVYFDALYCYSKHSAAVLCGGKPQYNGTVLFEGTAASTKRTYRGALDYWTSRKPGSIPYEKSHVYRSSVRGYAGTVEVSSGLRETCARPDVKSCEGGFTVKIFGGQAKEPKLPLVVDFSIIVKGRPNVETSGGGSKPAGLLTSRLTGSGFVTLTERTGIGKIVRATATKGKLVHEDVYANGKTETIEFGIISTPSSLKKKVPGTIYTPTTDRLSLLLKVRDSNDPDCPAGSFLTQDDRFATLVLVPAGGVRDSAILAGLLTKASGAEPCLGHRHAWQNKGGADPRDRVTVRIKISERP